MGGLVANSFRRMVRRSIRASSKSTLDIAPFAGGRAQLSTTKASGCAWRRRLPARARAALVRSAILSEHCHGRDVWTTARRSSAGSTRSSAARSPQRQIQSSCSAPMSDGALDASVFPARRLLVLSLGRWHPSDVLRVRDHLGVVKARCTTPAHRHHADCQQRSSQHPSSPASLGPPR